MKKFSLTTEEHSTLFDPDTFRSSKVYQYYMYKYSVWFQFFTYHEAKKNYYNGSPSMSDSDFDRLEDSLKRKYAEIYPRYSCVGFNFNLYNAVKRIFDFFDRTVKDRFEKPWNEYASKELSIKMFDNEGIEINEEPDFDEGSGTCVEVENFAVDTIYAISDLDKYEVGQQMELFA